MHAVVEIFMLGIGTIFNRLFFSFFFLLLLDLPLSRFFIPIAAHLFPSSSRLSPPTVLAAITLVGLHIVIGSLWYYLLTVIAIVLFRMSRLREVLRRLWQTNRR